MLMKKVAAVIILVAIIITAAWFSYAQQADEAALAGMRMVNDANIDPGLEWSTFLGGSGLDVVMSLAIHASGDVIVAGATTSPDFPTTTGSYDTTFNGNYDMFLACLEADGSELLWSTYLGGSDTDWIYGHTLDQSGWITLAGLTRSSDFPTTQGAFDTTHNGDADAFVARLNADGTQLIYSTYLGHSGHDWALKLGVDTSGEAVIGGHTASSSFPTTPGAYDTSYNGVRDAFVTRLNADGTDLIYSSFLGGSGEEGYLSFQYPTDLQQMGMVIEESGDVILSSNTRSYDFPTTAGTYDTTYNGGRDAFVTRLNATGSDVVYSTFLGGSGNESGLCITVSQSGEATIGGATWSSDFPTTPGAYDRTLNGYNDVFLVRLDAAGSNLLYSTFIGGTEWDYNTGLTLNGSENAIITGRAGPGFPTTSGAYDTTNEADGFLSVLNPVGNGEQDLIYSTFFGGSNEDCAYGGLALVDDGTIVLAGVTNSHDFPTTSGAFDTTHNGDFDGFVCRFVGFPVGIQEDIPTVSVPSTYTLAQNYPNPFNTSTEIRYLIGQDGHVTLKVFNTLGQAVRTLVDSEQKAGEYVVKWNGRNDGEREVASGLYFCRLRVGDFNKAIKMVLVK